MMPDEVTVAVDDRQPRDVVVVHQRGRVLDRVVGVDGDRLARS